MSETKNMTPETYAKFLESLKVTKAGDFEEGIAFSEPVSALKTYTQTRHMSYTDLYSFIKYLIRRIEISESNAKPETLLEKVKEAVRAGMDASDAYREYPFPQDAGVRDKFRRLSEAGEP